MKYVPKKTKIKDNRNDDGGYYIAKCVVCGSEYYPKKSTALYCSEVCNQKAFLKQRKESEAIQKEAERVANIAKAEEEKLIAEQKESERVANEAKAIAEAKEKERKEAEAMIKELKEAEKKAKTPVKQPTLSVRNPEDLIKEVMEQKARQKAREQRDKNG